ALEEDLLELVLGQAVPERGAYVQRELLPVTERDQGRDRDRAASPAIEARTRPDLTPGVARDQVLEVRGEGSGVRRRAVDVLVAEHLAARPHAVVVAHCRCSVTSRLNSCGRSTGTRCAASGIASKRA